MCQSYHPSMSLKKRSCAPLKVSRTFNGYYNLLQQQPPSATAPIVVKAATTPIARKRSVRFATHAQTTFLSTPTTPNNTTSNNPLYYTSDEIAQFRTERKRTIKILHLRYILASSNPHINIGEAAAFEGCVLTGIENMLTPELCAKSSKRRGAVVKAVLDEQARQREQQGGGGCLD